MEYEKDKIKKFIKEEKLSERRVMEIINTCHSVMDQQIGLLNINRYMSGKTKLDSTDIDCYIFFTEDYDLALKVFPMKEPILNYEECPSVVKLSKLLDYVRH